MAAFQNLNNNDYEEFVNSVVKDVTENNLFWSDDDKKLCYNHWLTVSVISKAVQCFPVFLFQTDSCSFRGQRKHRNPIVDTKP